MHVAASYKIEHSHAAGSEQNEPPACNYYNHNYYFGGKAKFVMNACAMYPNGQSFSYNYYIPSIAIHFSETV